MKLISGIIKLFKALFLCVLLLGSGAGIWWLADRPSAEKFYAEVILPRYDRLQHQLYDRRVVVLGARNVSKEQISAQLPHEKNNIYWWINHKSIAEQIARIKLIYDAQINFCSDTVPPNCFSIEVTERTPAFIAIRGSTAALLDSQGNELDSVAQEELANKLQQLMDVADAKPKVVVGLYMGNSSSDQVLARFEYVKQAVSKIEEESRIEFSTIELLPSGELLLKPSKAHFNVQFDNSWQDLEGLSDQVKRLKLVLGEVAPRLHEVTKIDLAFSRLAVVAYVEPTPAPKASSKTAAPKKR